MSRLAGKAAVVGIAYSELERRSERSIGAVTLETVKKAVEDAGLSLADIDGLTTYPEIPVFGSASIEGIDVVTVGFVARQLGLTNALRWHTQTRSLVPNSFVEAVNAVASGVCDNAVVFRSMHNPASAGQYNAFTADRAAGASQFTAPFGMHRGYQYYGGAYHRYMHRYGATREHMATLIVNTRENARRNPYAYFRDQPLTREDYLNARMLADPVCLLDCDIPVDGAVALVLTSGERARDRKQPPAYVAGYGQYVSEGGDAPQDLALGPPLEHVQEASRMYCDRMWESSGLQPGDVKAAQLYDGYSFFVYWWLEALGFCGEGEAFEFIQDGRIALDGELPVNTFGGQLGEGRLHGIGHIAEAARQAAGRAGERQVPDADVCIAGVGPLTHGSVPLAFTREPV